MFRFACILLTLLLAVLSGCGVRAKTQINTQARIYAAHNNPVCLLAGEPPGNVRYEVLGRVVATKRTYGSPDELYAPMVREAQKLGADALIRLQADQRFKGPMPWRITSPTGDSSAIKVLDPTGLDCSWVGGKLYGGNGVSPIRPIEGPKSSAAINEPAPTPRGKYEDLERLKKLLDQGALTQEEFDSEKKKLLAE